MRFKALKNREIFTIFCLFCLCIFSINLAINYHKYQIFMDKGEQELTATVISSYEKLGDDGKKRQILKLKTDEFTFYTLGAKTDDFKAGDNIFLSVINLDVSFKDYLASSFYMPSFSREKLPQKATLNINQKLQSLIYTQHENSKISQLYSALFLGTSIDGKLRDDVSHLGIAHLIAISGYHLGFISAVIFFVFRPLLKFLYARFLPFRNYNFDLAIVVFIVLSFYFFIIGFIPSFLRAFLMSILGFYCTLKGVKILNFKTLFIVALVSISLFLQLLFSVGFYFSLMGVFYIFLYFKHLKDKFSPFIHLILLNLYVCFAMEICVLYFFPLISLQQLSVLAINYIFSVFYPLSAALHIASYGDIFDGLLNNVLNFRLSSTKIFVPAIIFIFYNIASLLAIKFRSIFYILPLLGFLCFAIASYKIYA
ncbi:competence protein [Campylobacter concisus]|uniref:ComEC/Rec2 family competence protein n=1 Tax=Campylobacter concisus TaxID=199 RepID=UPI000A1FD2E0|nr:ComEC/Rec2 family competence protein [Campylobacter concisus]OSQ23081.1 competence protein [Campylobacter concisus]